MMPRVPLPSAPDPKWHGLVCLFRFPANAASHDLAWRQAIPYLSRLVSHRCRVPSSRLHTTAAEYVGLCRDMLYNRGDKEGLSFICSR